MTFTMQTPDPAVTDARTGYALICERILQVDILDVWPLEEGEPCDALVVHSLNGWPRAMWTAVYTATPGRLAITQSELQALYRWYWSFRERRVPV